MKNNILAVWHSISNICSIKVFRKAVMPKFNCWAFFMPKPQYKSGAIPPLYNCNGYTKPCEKTLIVGKVAPLF